jgi:hypothetical protein
MTASLRRRMLAAGGYAALFAVVLGAIGRHGGAAWELASLLVTLGYPLMLLVVTAHALAAWRRYRGRAVLPLGLLLTGVPAVAGVRSADGELHDRRFARHFAELEALVTRAPLDVRHRARLPVDSLPAAVRDCCALVVVRRDSVGQLSATFLGRGKTGYLYDPSGSRIRRGIGARRWRSFDRLAPEWYRVVNF